MAGMGRICVQYVPRTLFPLVRRRIRVAFCFAFPIGRHEIGFLVPRRLRCAIIDVYSCPVQFWFDISITALGRYVFILVPFPHGGHISFVAFESQVTLVAFSIRRNHVPF